jgi:hypothetical protein
MPWPIPTILLALLTSASFSHQPTPVTIRTLHDSASELATKAQLERLESQYNLTPWTFTHEVVIDAHAIPHSHPVLTLHTRHLQQDDELLSTYVHEQLHWYFSAHPTDTEAAEQDLMKLYPDVPVGYPEGGEDRNSTYLHLLVCWSEEQADLSLLGKDRTAAVMQFWAGDHYRWIYRTVLQDGPKIAAILKSHHLDNPSATSRDAVASLFPIGKQNSNVLSSPTN